MKKSNNNIFETLCSTEAGARLLVDTIISNYGVKDFLQCVFFGFNEADQEKFLASAVQKAGVR